MNGANPLNCEEALRLLAEHLDRELDADVNQAVEEHLHRCRSCFSRAEFERRLKARIGALREAPVDVAFGDRIHSLIGRFAAEERGSGPGNPIVPDRAPVHEE